MRNPLKVAQSCLLRGLPVPADIQAVIISMGIDFGAYERRFVQNNALSE